MMATFDMVHFVEKDAYIEMKLKMYSIFYNASKGFCFSGLLYVFSAGVHAINCSTSMVHLFFNCLDLIDFCFCCCVYWYNDKF